MRVLIVGAGVAGLTLASLLNQRGIMPDIIEKADSFGDAGYMIGLFPLGSNVFHGLGCYDSFIQQTEKLSVYQLYENQGNLLREFTFADFSGKFGAYQCTTRANLLNILRQNCENIPIQFATTVENIMQTSNVVRVKFNTGVSKEYDLVVGSDGIHSHIRDLILEQNAIEYFDSGWGGFVWWGDKKAVPSATVCEFWGDKFFIGAYPTENKLGLIMGCKGRNSQEALNGQSRKEFLTSLAYNVIKKHPELFVGFPEDQENMFYWQLSDVKCNKWHKGRVVLLGDAATAFLPTAGIGASMAIESASVLNDVLSRTGPQFVETGLQIYEKRRKQRVEDAQTDSRRLSKLMFIDSPLKSASRDVFFKLFIDRMSAQDFIKNIINALVEPA